MFKNYVKVSLRNLGRQRLYTLLNLAGLSAGFAGFLLLGLYLADELQFDRMHAKAGRIYRIVEEKITRDGRTVKTAANSWNLAARSVQDIAEVESALKMGVFGRANVYASDPQKAIYVPMWLSDDSFGKVFDFNWLQGDRNTALEKPFTVVLTQSTARRVFGTENVLGKTLRIDQLGDNPITVTGVLEDFPKNSHLDIPYALSMSSLNGARWFENAKASDWSSNSFSTYLILHPDASPLVVAEKLNQLSTANMPADLPNKPSFSLLALPDIHFYGSGIEGIGERTTNPAYSWIFAAVALFLLGIACINYINLATARAISRSKEVGVRKAVGAARKQLAGQFLTETLVMTTMAMLLAVILLQFILPAFNRFTDKTLTLNFSSDPRLWAGVVVSALLAALLAGLYPAFYLSRMRPLVLFQKVFKGGKWEFPMRKMLVVAQFGLSVLFIIGAVTVWRQLKYVQEKNLGFRRDQLLVVDINSGSVRRSAEQIKAGFAQIPAVQSVSVTSRVPGEWKNIPRVALNRTGGETAQSQTAWFIGADANFLSTYEAKLLRGRNFTPGSNADSAAVLLNETAARALGIAEPAGQWVEIPSVAFIGGQEALDQPFRAQVVGIVQDFHFQTLREKIEPLVLAHPRNPVHAIDYFSARIQTGDVPGTLAQLEKVLHAVDPGHLFEYHFLDDQWALFYREDAQRGKIATAAALMAVFIACLGLFGLATFAAEKRIKEIGVRKVLGASVVDITGLLTKDFLKLVGISVALASPIAWYAMQRWLSDFAYRTDLPWWLFAAAGAAALVIAGLTVSVQSIKAALSNPVQSLRNE